MSAAKEVKRLVSSGLVGRDEYIVKGFVEELERMIRAASILERELVDAITSLIDNPPLDNQGNPRFITVPHIRVRVDHGRTVALRKDSDDQYQSERKSWVRDAKGVPECWKIQERYLTLNHPTEADKQAVLDSIREEMLKYPKGSEMYGLWMKAGKTWKEVRVDSH